MWTRCNSLRRAVLDIVAYQVHMCVVVLCMGQETEIWTNSLAADLDRCKSSNFILFKGESNWIQSNENIIFITALCLYWFHDSLWSDISLSQCRQCDQQRKFKCLFLPLNHHWFLHSLTVIIGTCHAVYRNLITLNYVWFPHHIVLPNWGLGLVKKLICILLSLSLWRYDEANKHYDAILQDDPTNTVSLRSGERKGGKIPQFCILPCFTLWSQLFAGL